MYDVRKCLMEEREHFHSCLNVVDFMNHNKIDIVFT